MPYVVNGIGTWYYGKDHVHRRKDVCEFCNNAGELVSYDTTHYFVIFFIPLIPLGRKRILHECPHCQKHRMLPLRKWEEAKAADITNVMEALDRDPENRDTILGALQLAMHYQDEVLFNKLADALAQHRRAIGIVLHCARNDVAGYLKTAAEMPEASRFEVNLL
jgi:hypothetical protein